MSKPLPLLLSVPHAGLRIPEEVADLCILPEPEVVRDGDEEASEIYDLASLASEFCISDVARAIVDLNRAPTDFRKDGVVKTHTCWDVPVYRTPPSPSVVDTLLSRYYHPYHARLSEIASTSGSSIRLAVDCHTMAEFGPPVAPDPGDERPMVCIGTGDGACPDKWARRLEASFRAAFPGDRVTVDRPFAGGYITRHHGREMPWVQLELSRTSRRTPADKRARVAAALTDFCTGFDFAR